MNHVFASVTFQTVSGARAALTAAVCVWLLLLACPARSAESQAPAPVLNLTTGETTDVSGSVTRLPVGPIQFDQASPPRIDGHVFDDIEKTLGQYDQREAEQFKKMQQSIDRLSRSLNAQRLELELQRQRSAEAAEQRRRDNEARIETSVPPDVPDSGDVPTNTSAPVGPIAPPAPADPFSPSVKSTDSPSTEIDPPPVPGPRVVTDSPVDRAAFADSLFGAGRYDVALPMYLEQLDQELPPAALEWTHYQIASCCRKLGRTSEAEKHFRVVAGLSEASLYSNMARWWLSEMSSRNDLRARFVAFRQTLDQFNQQDVK